MRYHILQYDGLISIDSENIPLISNEHMQCLQYILEKEYFFFFLMTKFSKLGEEIELPT